jgi:prepilin-type N-terminal cleavage/methylation domain-containing protein
MRKFPRRPPLPAASASPWEDKGFSLVEFLIASVILLIVSVSVFGVLTNVQRSSSYQTEVQAVLDNTRVAMETVTRILRQAGNDPRNTGFQGITITSSTQVQIQADLTGSAGGDTGDPDGDTGDSGENVTITYNAGTRSIDLTPNGGGAQTIATDISACSMQYFDANGAATNVGANVRKIRVTLSGASALPDPQTGQIFSQQLSSDVQIATRK